MRRRCLSYFLGIFLASAISPAGAEMKVECAQSAFKDYNDNLVILQKGTPFMSAGRLVAERRLEEQFCQRFVQCEITDVSSIPFAAAFAKCLREETVEKK